MSTNYYPEALMQEMLYLRNLREIDKLNQEIANLKAAIFSKQKKHRRCDKEISKSFNCPHCQRVYASDVALKLHLKLKHSPDKQQDEKSTTQSPMEHEISQEIL